MALNHVQKDIESVRPHPHLDPPACEAWVNELIDAVHGVTSEAFASHAAACAVCRGEWLATWMVADRLKAMRVDQRAQKEPDA